MKMGIVYNNTGKSLACILFGGKGISRMFQAEILVFCLSYFCFT